VAERAGHAETTDRSEITERAADRTEQARDALDELRRTVEQ
jgi:hypothetical protein